LRWEKRERTHLVALMLQRVTRGERSGVRGPYGVKVSVGFHMSMITGKEAMFPGVKTRVEMVQAKSGAHRGAKEWGGRMSVRRRCERSRKLFLQQREKPGK